MSHRKKSFADQEVDALKDDIVMCEHEALLRECEQTLVYLIEMFVTRDTAERIHARLKAVQLRERITEHLSV